MRAVTGATATTLDHGGLLGDSGSRGGASCRPDGLRAALQRLGWGAHAVSEVVLPPYPAVALRVQQELARPGTGIAELARLVKTDGALAAQLLRCANSALYRRGDPVTSLHQAMARIGTQQVMRVLLAAGLSGPAQAPGALASARRRVWIEGLASAMICQELARLRGLRAEEAFVLGLLHDFGAIVAMADLESLIADGRLDGRWSLDEVLEAVGARHVELGLAVARRWKLPPLVAGIIEGHHAQGGVGIEDPGLLEVVKASDEVVALLVRRPGLSSDGMAAGAPRVRPAEREAVAHVAERIPELVAALELPEPGREGAATRVQPPRPSPVADEWPVDVRVTVSVGRRPHEYDEVAVTADGLVVRGGAPMPENRLLEVTVQAGGEPLKMWALTRASRTEVGRCRTDLQPFALDGPARERWESLVSLGRGVAVMIREAREALAAAHDPACLLDPRGVILYVNPAWDRFAEENGGAPGALGSRVVGTRWLDHVRGREVRAHHEALFGAVLDEAGADIAARGECNTPDTFRLVVTRFARIAVPGGRGLAAIAVTWETLRREAIQERYPVVEQDGVAYRDAGGAFVQCSCCRRVRGREGLAEGRWDFVPSLVRGPAAGAEFALCDACAEAYLRAG